MKKYKRIFTIVLDSLGIGAMKDSEKFGDIGVDTLGNIAKSVSSLRSKYRKGYDDRALGDDGTKYTKTFPNFY